MAKFEKIIPFILRHEAGVAEKHLGKPMAELFEIARKTGFANDKRDSGGATLCGVTLGTYETYCRRKGYPRPTILRLKAMPFAHWLDICKGMYWDRWQADEICSQSVAEMLVDWVWASGAFGIKIPQRLLGVKADGIVGAKTLKAVNEQEPYALWTALRDERERYIENITKGKNACFRKGWLNRLNAMQFEG